MRGFGAVPLDFHAHGVDRPTQMDPAVLGQLLGQKPIETAAGVVFRNDQFDQSAGSRIARHRLFALGGLFAGRVARVCGVRRRLSRRPESCRCCRQPARRLGRRSVGSRRSSSARHHRPAACRTLLGQSREAMSRLNGDFKPGMPDRGEIRLADVLLGEPVVELFGLVALQVLRSLVGGHGERSVGPFAGDRLIFFLGLLDARPGIRARAPSRTTPA